MNRKHQNIRDLTNALIRTVCDFAKVEKVSADLEKLMSEGERNLPVERVYYPWTMVFNNKQILLPKYPELVNLDAKQPLPESVGEFSLDPFQIIGNEKYFISPIVRKTEELGFNKIYIDTCGIYFYLDQEDLGENATRFYDQVNLIAEISVPTLAVAVQKLESEIRNDHRTPPTHGVFYRFKDIFDDGTDWKSIVDNEEHYISKVVKKAKDTGFEGANVRQSGITFYIKPENLGPKALQLYRQFFLLPNQIIEKIKQSGNNPNKGHIILKFKKDYDSVQLRKINYELRKYYNSIGYVVTIGYDWRHDVDELVMKVSYDFTRKA